MNLEQFEKFAKKHELGTIIKIVEYDGEYYIVSELGDIFSSLCVKTDKTLNKFEILDLVSNKVYTILTEGNLVFLNKAHEEKRKKENAISEAKFNQQAKNQTNSQTDKLFGMNS